MHSLKNWTGRFVKFVLKNYESQKQSIVGFLANLERFFAHTRKMRGIFPPRYFGVIREKRLTRSLHALCSSNRLGVEWILLNRTHLSFSLDLIWGLKTRPLAHFLWFLAFRSVLRLRKKRNKRSCVQILRPIFIQLIPEKATLVYVYQIS